MTLIQGRFECHSHIFMNGFNYRDAVRRYSLGIDEQDVRQKLEAYRRAGVIYIRDGGDHYGAGIFARSIAGEYGIDYASPVFAIHKEGCYGKIVGRGFHDMREYAGLVREVKKLGGDFIKVMFSGILDFDTDGHVTGGPLSQDEMEYMIKTAHEEGFRVMAHVNGDSAVRSAVLCGVDSVEHGNEVSCETLQLMAERGTVWVPTISTIRNLMGTGRFDEKLIKALYERQAQKIREGAELGVLIAPGSDAGAFAVPHGQGTLDEYCTLTEIIGNERETVQKLNLAAERVRKLFCVRGSCDKE